MQTYKTLITHTFSAWQTHQMRKKLYRLVQDGEKAFEALVVPKTLTLTTLVDSHNHQAHAGTNKIYSLIKTKLFWKGMLKNVDNLIQNYCVCKQHNLQKQT